MHDARGTRASWRATWSVAGAGATLAPVTRVRHLPILAVVLSLGLAAPGCKNRRRDKGGGISQLTPPKDASPWESGLAVAYDDAYTPTSLNLQGRAPNDVLDQQLFQARLGYADLVMLVRVEQVWGKGRHEGSQDQFVEVEIGEVLFGSLPKNAPETLMLEVDNEELPGALKGEIMLLFLKWRVEREPPYHHHLMPADEELVALIKAMVKHAQNEGVLDAKGDEVPEGKQRKRKKRRKGKKDKDDGGGGAAEGGVGGGASSSGSAAAGSAAPPGGTSEPEQEDAAPAGPEPDASTGLQDLGGEAPAAEPEAEAELPPE